MQPTTPPEMTATITTSLSNSHTDNMTTKETTKPLSSTDSRESPYNEEAISDILVGSTVIIVNAAMDNLSDLPSSLLLRGPPDTSNARTILARLQCSDVLAILCKRYRRHVQHISPYIQTVPSRIRMCLLSSRSVCPSPLPMSL